MAKQISQEDVQGLANLIAQLLNEDENAENKPVSEPVPEIPDIKKSDESFSGNSISEDDASNLANIISSALSGEDIEPVEKKENVQSSEDTKSKNSDFFNKYVSDGNLVEDFKNKNTIHKSSQSDLDDWEEDPLVEETEATDKKDEEPVGDRFTSDLDNMLGTLQDRLHSADQEEDERIKLQRLDDEQNKKMNYTVKLAEISKVLSRAGYPNPKFTLDPQGNISFEIGEFTEGETAKESTKNNVNTGYDISKPTLLSKVAKWRGKEKQSKTMFNDILKSIEYKGVDLRDVLKLGIFQDTLTINGRNVNIGSNLYNSDWMDFVDIIDFPTIYKKMPNIEQLYLSYDAMNRLYASEGNMQLNSYQDVIAMLFNRMRRLTTFVFVAPDGTECVVGRQDLGNADFAKSLRKVEEANTMANMMDVACAGMNNTQGLGEKKESKIKAAMSALRKAGKGKNIPKKVAKVGAVAAGTVALATFVSAPILVVGAAGTIVHTIAKAASEVGGNKTNK